MTPIALWLFANLLPAHAGAPLRMEVDVDVPAPPVDHVWGAVVSVSGAKGRDKGEVISDYGGIEMTCRRQRKEVVISLKGIPEESPTRYPETLSCEIAGLDIHVMLHPKPKAAEPAKEQEQEQEEQEQAPPP